MRVRVLREPQRLQFSFETDESDAIPPLSSVWFRHDRINRVDTLAMALMGYLLARQFIGNRFELSGIQLPAHLATRIFQDFDAHEFFLGSISNQADHIPPREAFQKLILPLSDRHYPEQIGRDTLFCIRRDLGYSITNAPGNDESLLFVATNVDLFSAFSHEPRLLSGVLIYLCTSGALEIRQLLVQGESRPRNLTGMSGLFREIGARTEFENNVRT